jgi:esterase
MGCLLFSMELFYQKLGQGPSLIILHGLYGASDNWITVARKLSDRYTVYLVDQRNHGKSPHHSVHTYEAMSDDMEELMEKEHLGKVFLMGHSMGGKTAMLFCARHPERIAGLVIVDISPGSYASLSEYSPHAISHMNIVNAMLSVDFAKYTTRGEIELELANTIADLGTRQFIMKNVMRNADGSFAWKLNLDAIRKALPNILAAIPLEKVLQNSVVDTFPVLFIRGGRSDYITDEDVPYIHQYFPNAVFEKIPDAGHWVHAEQPVLFLEAISKILI